MLRPTTSRYFACNCSMVIDANRPRFLVGTLSAGVVAGSSVHSAAHSAAGSGVNSTAELPADSSTSSAASSWAGSQAGSASDSMGKPSSGSAPGSSAGSTADSVADRSGDSVASCPAESVARSPAGSTANSSTCCETGSCAVSVADTASGSTAFSAADSIAESFADSATGSETGTAARAARASTIRRIINVLFGLLLISPVASVKRCRNAAKLRDSRFSLAVVVVIDSLLVGYFNIHHSHRCPLLARRASVCSSSEVGPTVGRPRWLCVRAYRRAVSQADFEPYRSCRPSTMKTSSSEIPGG